MSDRSKSSITERILFIAIIFSSSLVEASIYTDQPSDPPPNQRAVVHLWRVLKEEISKGYAGASVEFTSPVQWTRGVAPEEITKVSLLGDDGKGNSHFIVQSGNGQSSEGWVSFRAWMPAKIATHRTRVGEALSPENFITQDVDLASGLAHEYRGVILPAKTSLSGLETLQTILEGQYLTSKAVRRIPDVRRGDSVQVHLIAGNLVLSTLGVAEEPGYIHQQVRIRTSRTKKEFSGLLKSEGLIEVKL